MSKQEEAGKKFCAGNEAFVDENFDQAIQCYTEAIEICTDNADYYLKRCNAYIKKEDFSDAVKDADMSIKLNKMDVRPYQRKGFALFSLKQYKEALKAYEDALKIDENNEQIKLWIRKCEAEINLSEKGGCTKNKTNIGLSRLHKSHENTSKAVHSDINTKTQQQPALTSKIKHDWYQTETHIVITVLIKNLNRDDVNTEFTANTLSFSAKLSSGSEYNLELDLAHPIVPEESLTRVLSTKAEIKLKKVEGIRWSSLETDNESQFANIKSESIKTSEDAVHKYPTSRHLYTDWDQLAKEVQEEEKKENSEGDAALNALFKQIYADGSDEVKRAMNKSFQESGGTVLSTNWAEIKKETVEVKPPDCMEYKKYEY
ncbi:protein SGT1 homolog [Hydractinia symbiolongicarpus]|uniref:protein SGT1 homolog n=1 Tax=Hydractinia symbiolongicarpus TaxID=13093 RepID=UPI002550BCB4|nr:protein SGT1 homolog [Hydractinia symbiolongicarpus]